MRWTGGSLQNKRAAYLKRGLKGSKNFIERKNGSRCEEAPELGLKNPLPPLPQFHSKLGNTYLDLMSLHVTGNIHLGATTGLNPISREYVPPPGGDFLGLHRL